MSLLQSSVVRLYDEEGSVKTAFDIHVENGGVAKIVKIQETFSSYDQKIFIPLGKNGNYNFSHMWNGTEEPFYSRDSTLSYDELPKGIKEIIENKGISGDRLRDGSTVTIDEVEYRVKISRNVGPSDGE